MVDIQPIDEEKRDRLYAVICAHLWDFEVAPKIDGREMDIAYRHVIDGWTQNVIAKAYYISHSTVEVCWKRLSDRVNLPQRYLSTLPYPAQNHVRSIVRFNLMAAYWIAVGEEQASG